MDWSSVIRVMTYNPLRAVLLLCLIICFVCGLSPTHVTWTGNRTTCLDRPCYLPQQCKEEPEQNATCTCGADFTGDRCDVIKLKHILNWNITTEDVAFTWKDPIILVNYRAALYKKYVKKPPKVIKYYDIPNGNHTNLTFGGLEVFTTYVVCIVRVDEIEPLWNESTFTVTLGKDRECCFSFTTSYNGRSPETIAAITMGITVGSITGILFLVGVIRACMANKREKEKPPSQPPSRTSSKRGSKRSVRPRSGSVKKTAWKYEGTTPLGTPRASREKLDTSEFGSCESVASVAGISVTVLDESGRTLEVDLSQVDADDQAVPT
ncbi:uncharacterized protein LOC135496869 [Lineus longissimus]|uniref:uncharacterized protein LOC135496869 n=1 Tax=Lineus longissimus TaxID=88925 RepID=UPI00315CB7F2